MSNKFMIAHILFLDILGFISTLDVSQKAEKWFKVYF